MNPPLVHTPDRTAAGPRPGTPGEPVSRRSFLSAPRRLGLPAGLTGILALQSPPVAGADRPQNGGPMLTKADHTHRTFKIF